MKPVQQWQLGSLYIEWRRGQQWLLAAWWVFDVQHDKFGTMIKLLRVEQGVLVICGKKVR